MNINPYKLIPQFNHNDFTLGADVYTGGVKREDTCLLNRNDVFYNWPKVEMQKQALFSKQIHLLFGFQVQLLVKKPQPKKPDSAQKTKTKNIICVQGTCGDFISGIR